MDAYQYALMKETLERIQNIVTGWRDSADIGRDKDEDSFDSMYCIETILDEAGFHE